jgi:ribonuclease HI
MPQIKEKINKKKDPYENFVFTNLLIPKTEDKNVWNNFLISCITSIYDLICWVISLDDKSEKSIIYAIMILIDEILSASDINVKTVKDMVAMLNYKMKIRENYIETLSNIYDWNDYSEYYIIVDESPENMDYLISIDGSADGDNSGGGIYVRYLVNNVFVEEKYFFEIDPNLKYLRNVAGELLSAIFAVQLAIKKGWSKLNLVFDYIGIPLYFLKVWSSNDMNIQNYRNSMLKLIAKSGLKIEWLKVYSHTNIRINEVADQLAKIGSKVLEPSLDTVKIEQPSFIVKDDAYSCVVC